MASIMLAVREGESRALRGGQTHKQITCLKMKSPISDVAREEGERVWDELGEELQLVYQKSLVGMTGSTLIFRRIHLVPS